MLLKKFMVLKNAFKLQTIMLKRYAVLKMNMGLSIAK